MIKKQNGRHYKQSMKIMSLLWTTTEKYWQKVMLIISNDYHWSNYYRGYKPCKRKPVITSVSYQKPVIIYDL